MQWCIFECFGAADGTSGLILPQYIHFFAHVQEWLHTLQIQLIEFFHKTNHALQVIFNRAFFGIGKFQPGKMGQFVH